MDTFYLWKVRFGGKSDKYCQALDLDTFWSAEEFSFAHFELKFSISPQALDGPIF